MNCCPNGITPQYPRTDSNYPHDTNGQELLKRLATGSDDKTVKLWNAATAREVLTLEGHTKAIINLAFSPDGTRLISGGYDKIVKMWDVNAGRRDDRGDRDRFGRAIAV